MSNPLALLIPRTLSLGVSLLTAYAVVDYPYAAIGLGVGLLLYFVALQFLPLLWLLVIPALLPILNLAPWSGRFFLEDFDFVILTSIAGLLWQGSYRFSGRPQFRRLPTLLIAALLLTHTIALVHGVLPLAAWDANAFSNYYSHYNALRVGKSLLWAVLLIPPVLRAFSTAPQQARQSLLFGVTLGLLGNGLAMVWERGVLTDLVYGQSLYAKMAGLTDFSREYRGTGLFAEMHTGGEAIDGYIALAWPFALGCLAIALPRVWLAGMMSLPAGLYSALVTFSRGTYLAVAVSLFSFAVPYALHLCRNTPRRGLWAVPVVLCAAVVGCVVLYGKGGHYALLAALAIMSGSIVASFLPLWRPKLRTAALAMVFMVGLALMLRGLLTSKWVANDWAESLLICVPMTAALLLAGMFIGTQLRAMISLRGLGISLVFALILVAVAVPSLSGSYMQARFATAGGDFSGRWTHWRHALGLMDAGLDTFAFGMGLGVFPQAYLRGNEAEKSSIAALRQSGDNTYLSLSNSMDLAIGQRVNLLADETYVLSLDARSDTANAKLALSICRRNIIVPYDDECVATEIPVADAQWQPLNWTVNLGAVGDGRGIGRRPLVLRISHFYYNPQSETNMPLAFIDIDNVSVRDAYGDEQLVNGDFSAGLDRWYPSSDHAHLPLHIKNLWLNVYFEQGILGLLAFSALSGYALLVGMRLARGGDGFALTLLAALMGFFSVGLIGTLYDVPRVCFLFFLLLFTLLAQDGAQLTGFATTRGRTAARRGFVQPVRTTK